MALIAKTTAGFFNCENLDGFIESISVIHPFEGVSKSTFYSCHKDHVAFFVKVSLHTDTNNKGLSQVDTEVQILGLLTTKIIRAKKTPCVLEMVTYKTCKVSRLKINKQMCDALCTGVKIPTSVTDGVNVTFCRYKDLVAAGLARDKVTFMVLDKCNFTMEEYLKKYTDVPVHFAVFRAMLFMIIHAFCVICEQYPDFWHADLHLRNVMISIDPAYVYSAERPRYLVLKYKGKSYSVPYVGLIPKIIDFGHSEIPSHGIRSPASSDVAFRYRRSRNDILLLLHCIYVMVGDHREISKLLTSLDPTMSYTAFYTPKIDEKKIPSYDAMLETMASDYSGKIIPGNVYDEFK